MHLVLSSRHMEQFGPYREDRNPAPFVFRAALRNTYEVCEEELPPTVEALLARLDSISHQTVQPKWRN